MLMMMTMTMMMMMRTLTMMATMMTTKDYDDNTTTTVTMAMKMRDDKQPGEHSAPCGPHTLTRSLARSLPRSLAPSHSLSQASTPLIVDLLHYPDKYVGTRVAPPPYPHTHARTDAHTH